jgi:FkbM family methyltransferase
MMNNFNLRGSPSDSLKIISNLLIDKIKTVVDIGVQTQTKCLMDVFPNAFHYLFEPATPYHNGIHQNYSQKGFKYKLIPKAVSDSQGKLYQHLLSNSQSSFVTHSQLLPNIDRSTFGNRLVSIEETDVIALDDFFSSEQISNPYLVKIDVDGIEEKIIDGGKMTLSNAAVIVVESPLVHLSTRLAKLQALNLQLFDICGQGYYMQQLSQVDLIFVSKKIVASNIDFRPWEKSKGCIEWSEWVQFD